MAERVSTLLFDWATERSARLSMADQLDGLASSEKPLTLTTLTVGRAGLPKDVTTGPVWGSITCRPVPRRGPEYSANQVASKGPVPSLPGYDGQSPNGGCLSFNSRGPASTGPGHRLHRARLGREAGG